MTMSGLMDFAQERVKGLISKKVGAAVVAEGAVAGTDGAIPSGLPTIIYLLSQALVDAAKAYGEGKASS
jgi:hypothetical protein